MITEFIHWHVNPEIFRIGNFAIRWYGLLFASAFFFGYLIMAKMFKWENVPEPLLDKLTLYMAVGTIVGARLGHVFFYEPGYYLHNPLEILKVWHGGLASHGAAIGILLAIYIFSRETKRPFLWAIDRIVVVVALSGFFIRMGNLMNSEIYGIPTKLPWGFIFERNGETIPKHPTQIYEALSYLTIFVVLYLIYLKKKEKLTQGLLFSLFLILVFTARFFIEFIKEVQVNFERTLPLDMGQILSIPFILTGVVLLFIIYRKKKPQT
ncbi:MAG: prolipoprotein diacylglyceryl transferase [Chlorobi bacterium]|nr:prolipoprotein diacylglyceryl transferase [Chlorobiota bacterium]